METIWNPLSKCQWTYHSFDFSAQSTTQNDISQVLLFLNNAIKDLSTNPPLALHHLHHQPKTLLHLVLQHKGRLERPSTSHKHSFYECLPKTRNIKRKKLEATVCQTYFLSCTPPSFLSWAQAPFIIESP
jgi:hypothetical protein